MSPEVAKNALTFLNRVPNIAATEIAEFVNVCTSLQQFAEGAAIVTPVIPVDAGADKAIDEVFAEVYERPIDVDVDQA